MSVQSMTGYADAQEALVNPSLPGVANISPSSRIGFEIRSVNSRFLDLTLRLPEDLRGAEPKLRELVSRRIHRGKVDIRVYQDDGASTAITMPPVPVLQKLEAIQNMVLSWIPNAAPLAVSDVIKLAGGGAQPSTAKIEKVMVIAEIALETFVESRENEGGRLARVLLEKLGLLHALVVRVTPLIPILIEAQKQRFIKRWGEALGAIENKQISSDALQERALSEATLYALRIDVAEELTRLDSHLIEIEKLLKKGGEIGKKLDFLIQELHREANTLGAKSGSLELTKIAMEMKILIEQMREQVQNLE